LRGARGSFFSFEFRFWQLHSGQCMYIL
jgi:hypothetical protein